MHNVEKREPKFLLQNVLEFTRTTPGKDERKPQEPRTEMKVHRANGNLCRTNVLRLLKSQNTFKS